MHSSVLCVKLYVVLTSKVTPTFGPTGEGGDHNDAQRRNIRGDRSDLEWNCVQSDAHGSGLQRSGDTAVCYRGTHTHTHIPIFIMFFYLFQSTYSYYFQLQLCNYICCRDHGLLNLRLVNHFQSGTIIMHHTLCCSFLPVSLIVFNCYSNILLFA